MINYDVVVGLGIVPYHLGCWRLPGGETTADKVIATIVAANINRIIRSQEDLED